VNLLPILLLCSATVWSCSHYGLYGTRHAQRPWQEALTIAKAVARATVLVLVFAWLSGATASRIVLVAATGTLIAVLFLTWRVLDRYALEHRAANGHGVRNVLIVGAGNVGQQFARFLERNLHLGYRLKGFLDSDLDGDRVLGRIADLRRVAWAEFIDDVFIAAPLAGDVVAAVKREAESNHFDVRLVPDLYGAQRLKYIGEFPVVALHNEPVPELALIAKRILDVFVSGTSLVLLFPLMLLVALAIKLDSPGSVFYRSDRVGKKGRTFVCYKFRTMITEADRLKHQLRELNERKGLLFKVRHDPRITRIGAFLRKYSIDELPQLWNVLVGEMSLVGPRPPSVDEYEQYSLEHLRRLSVKPGITGLWQVKARQDPSFETAVALDLEYINTWSPRLDLKLLLQTFSVVLKGTGY
jgi:exopolysaccharide biosynthesis polyprenyl glycosylphosphotransferase